MQDLPHVEYSYKRVGLGLGGFALRVGFHWRAMMGALQVGFVHVLIAVYHRIVRIEGKQLLVVLYSLGSALVDRFRMGCIRSIRRLLKVLS